MMNSTNSILQYHGRSEIYNQKHFDGVSHISREIPLFGIIVYLSQSYPTLLL